jgi:kynurenine formamidase
MKLFYFSAALLFCSACKGPAGKTESNLFSGGEWIDLSYSFSKETLYWPNNPTGFTPDTLFEGQTPGGYYYSSFGFSAPEHGGTHLDAPVHFAKGKKTTDELSLSQLTGEAAVIDVSSKAANDRDYLAAASDITDWENQHGVLPDSVILLFRTGYGKYYPDAKKYFGTDKKGDSAIAQLHFPGIDPQLAEWLLKNRKIKAVGIDTPSIDYGQSSDFKTHRILLAENIPVFENVAHMDLLPATSAYIVALPMKIKNGSGGPLHIIAFVPRN